VGPRRLTVLLLALVALAGCAGPRPRVERVSLTPPERVGDPYLVEAVVKNAGRGRGEVKVLLHLTGSAGRFAEEKRIDLSAGETASVIAEFRAPPGVYAPSAEVQYPPD
jgi:hypothetical protein